MICSCAYLAFTASSYHIARAILIRAQEGASTMYFFLFCRLSGVERDFRTFWITGHTTNLGELGVVVRAIPVGRPLPNVTGHVVQPVTVGREFAHGRNPDETIRAGVLIWKMSLKGV